MTQIPDTDTQLVTTVRSGTKQLVSSGIAIGTPQQPLLVEIEVRNAKGETVGSFRVEFHVSIDEKSPESMLKASSTLNPEPKVIVDMRNVHLRAGSQYISDPLPVGKVGATSPFFGFVITGDFAGSFSVVYSVYLEMEKS